MVNFQLLILRDSVHLLTQKKKNFMEKFVLPESIKILESRLKVTSNSIIPAFDPAFNGCDDDGKLTVDAKYKTDTTAGDFLLLVGVINEPDSGTLAYATFCVLGNFRGFLNFQLHKNFH